MTTAAPLVQSGNIRIDAARRHCLDSMPTKGRKRQMTNARQIAEQLSQCAADDIQNLVDRDTAMDALVGLSGKAAIARLALQQIESGMSDMTIPVSRGLIAILDEIGDGAWNVARIQFVNEWTKRYATE
jgi:hypothetical protein